MSRANEQSLRFEVPKSPVPLLPLRSGALFPFITMTLPVGRERSVALLRTIEQGSVIAVVAQRDPSSVHPREGDLYNTGVFARVREIVRTADREYRVTLDGLHRMQLDRLVTTEPFWKAECTLLQDRNGDGKEAQLLATSLLEHVTDLAKQNGGSLAGLENDPSQPSLLADQIAAGLGLTTEKEMQVLATVDVVERLRLVASLVSEVKASADVKRRIDADVRKEFNKHQREALLREQLKAIQRELGDDKSDDELAKLKEKLAKAELPEEVQAIADRELRRLEGMNGQQAEGHVIRTYLETLADLPWNKRAAAKNDIDNVAQKLEEDHFGLQDVKRRILEHMAVLKLSGNPRGSILCFAGPPGVGKTSLGQSIADATGRPFIRIALGGIRDEAEIRGHRRTYVGALPGRIIAALRKVKVKNPVILLDEIDKLTTSWNGSPEAALLEVLDPEQNKIFTDHYVEASFDLSEVLFICTVNQLDALSAPLRDRLEVIEIAGYTPEEKVHIARKHLISRQVKEHAIAVESLQISDVHLSTIVREYTREAGVRQLNRELGKICRSVALEVARAKDQQAPTVVIDETLLEKFLGRAKFHQEVIERTRVPGVATGLAWTPIGGDVLFVETSRMPGKGGLEITGQLGDIMKESARAALTYVRSHADTLGVATDFLTAHDLHIHVPAGAVPKDGPSAGVTMFTALTSLLTGRRVRSDTAMTGECTLRGRVLPVGGIKAKVLAAHRFGVTRVILPKGNARDIEEVPEQVRAQLEFIFAEDMSQVLDAALEPHGNVPAEVPIIPGSTSNTVRNVAL